MRLNLYNSLKGGAFSLLLLGAAQINGQSTFTFTNGTATGNTGPDQTMMDTEYTGTSLDGDVLVVGGIQYWEVPTTGTYSIEAYGGQGYGSFGGRGAHIYGEFSLTAGDTLKILVGQMAGDYLDYPATTYNHQFGGGGGSFVTYTDNTPLVVAGGGGGNHGTAYISTCDGQAGTAGEAGSNASTVGAGGTAGLGGMQATSADGGGGLLGDGDGDAGGQSFVNGGLGGIDEGTGGFGCGGGTSSWNNYRGGGGGGYSGGGGGNNSTTCCPAGGGGGSYNAGTNQNNLPGVQTGHGLVVVSNLCTPSVSSLVADVTTLPDLVGECTVDMPSAPTATNDCGNAVSGTPDVSFPITGAGTTVVTWTYDDGVNTITQTQNVVIAPPTGVTQNGEVLLADSPGYAYQWLDCDNSYAPVSGAISQYFTPSDAGNYAVEVTHNGCVDTSACINAAFSGITGTSFELAVYPNPTDGMFKVNTTDDIRNIQLFDAVGRKLEVDMNLNTGEVDGSNLPAGKYFLRIVTSTVSTTRVVVMNK